MLLCCVVIEPWFAYQIYYNPCQQGWYCQTKSGDSLQFSHCFPCLDCIAACETFVGSYSNTSAGVAADFGLDENIPSKILANISVLLLFRI